jgi:hypothetical protein
MTIQKLIAAALISVAATPIIAQDLNWSVEGSVRSFTDSELDETLYNLRGGAEIGFGRGFAFGGNLAVADDPDTDTTNVNATVRGMYLVSPTSAAGLFVGVDNTDDTEATSYGIEFGSTFAASEFEAYYGGVDADEFGADTDVSLYGLSAEFALTPAVSLGAAYNAFTVSEGSVDVTLGDASLLARYTFNENTSVFAKVGQIGISADVGGESFVGSEEAEYIGIGAAYRVGRNGGGNIFGERTIFGFGS